MSRIRHDLALPRNRDGEPPRETNDDRRILWYGNGDVTVLAPTARSQVRAPAPYRRVSDSSPGEERHVCPLCGLAFPWPAFVSHARPCIARHPELVAAVKAGEQHEEERGPWPIL